MKFGINLTIKVLHFYPECTLRPLASKYTGYNTVIKLGSYVASVAFSYFADDFFDFTNKIDTPIESFSMINRLFDTNQTLSQQEFSKIYTIVKTVELCDNKECGKSLIQTIKLHNILFYPSFHVSPKFFNRI